MNKFDTFVLSSLLGWKACYAMTEVFQDFKQSKKKGSVPCSNPVDNPDVKYPELAPFMRLVCLQMLLCIFAFRNYIQDLFGQQMLLCISAFRNLCMTFSIACHLMFLSDELLFRDYISNSTYNFSVKIYIPCHL